MTVEKYLKEMEYRGLSPQTIYSRRHVLNAFTREIGKQITRITREQVLEWIASRNLSKSTQAQYRHWLNAFFQWAKAPIELPELKVKKKLLRRQDLVTREEVKRLLEVADHPRDRALIHVLYETGGRASEVLGIKLQDIEFGETLVRIRLDGKTGTRIVPVFECVGNLQMWLNFCRPLKPNEGIWQGRFGPITPVRLGQILRTLSMSALGRRISPHKLRHSCATELLKNPHFTEALVRLRFGWTQSSPIIERYSHLVNQDLENETLAAHGMKPAKELIVRPLHPVTCSRCQASNPVGARYCNRCSLVLDVEEAQRIAQRDQELLDFIEYLVDQRPDTVRRLAQDMRTRR